MRICKVVKRCCCCCCCCCRSRSEEDKSQHMEKEEDAIEIQECQEATMDLEAEPDDANKRVVEEENEELSEVHESESESEAEDSSSDEEDEQESLHGPNSDSEFILSKFKKEIIQALLKEIPFGSQSPDIILIGYTSHFVAGTDYYLKILERVSGNYFHVRVYESLQGDIMLQRLSAPKRFEDPIRYF